MTAKRQKGSVEERIAAMVFRDRPFPSKLPSIADVITISHPHKGESGPRTLFSVLLPYKLYTVIPFDPSSIIFTPALRRIQFGLPSQFLRRIS